MKLDPIAAAVKAVFIIAFLAGSTILAGVSLFPDRTLAHEFNPIGWTLPELYGAERVEDVMYDFDRRVPGNETRLEKFYTVDGGRVHRYSHRNKIFAYVVDHDRFGPMDYALVDYNGSGLFETRQPAFDVYPLPQWTFKPYLYPEVAMLSGSRNVAPSDLTGLVPSTTDLIAALTAAGEGESRVALTIQFDFDKATLLPEARATLNALGRAMVSEELKNSSFIIEGHTDSKGSFEYNQDLSRRRALSVQDYLNANFNIPLNKMIIVGKGETSPLPGSDPESGRNRRVEIVKVGTTEKMTGEKQIEN